MERKQAQNTEASVLYERQGSDALSTLPTCALVPAKAHADGEMRVVGAAFGFIECAHRVSDRVL